MQINDGIISSIECWNHIHTYLGAEKCFYKYVESEVTLYSCLNYKIK